MSSYLMAFKFQMCKRKVKKKKKKKNERQKRFLFTEDVILSAIRHLLLVKSSILYVFSIYEAVTHKRPLAQGDREIEKEETHKRTRLNQ